jgi:hypothetical protein
VGPRPLTDTLVFTFLPRSNLTEQQLDSFTRRMHDTSPLLSRALFLDQYNADNILSLSAEIIRPPHPTRHVHFDPLDEGGVLRQQSQ